MSISVAIVKVRGRKEGRKEGRKSGVVLPLFVVSFLSITR